LILCIPELVSCISPPPPNLFKKISLFHSTPEFGKVALLAVDNLFGAFLVHPVCIDCTMQFSVKGAAPAGRRILQYAALHKSV